MSIIDSILKKDTEKEQRPPSRLFKGKILRLSSKGYGFVTTPELEFTRIFFHWSVLTMESPKFPELAPNMPVEFNAVELPDKGWRAVMVRVLNANSAKGKEQAN